MHVFYRLSIVFCWLFLLLSGSFHVTYAAVSASLVAASDSAIDTLRKRNCAITVKSSGGAAVSGVSISVKQIRHDFGFGAAIPYSILTDTNMQKVFLDHYEWAVFEDDLKWPSTDTSASGPDYAKPDSLFAFCQRNDIQVRGHNLFWNQKAEWLPAWVCSLKTSTEFMTAVNNRITNALGHYKGKISQWDVGNEVIHGNQLETRSKMDTIWNYIFSKCRATDSTLKLTINDYNIIEYYSDVDSFIRKIKSITNPTKGTKGPVDIIGLEGHFGSIMTQSNYKAKLDTLAKLNVTMWLTEVDFSVHKDIRLDKFEELIRTAFANRMVKGLMMWTFYGGHLWRDTLTSYIADSGTYEINDLGKRYDSLMQKWTTIDSGTTNDSGKYSFRGFMGKYVVSTKIDGKLQLDTVYLDTGKSVKSISIVNRVTGIGGNLVIGHSASVRNVRVNGTLISIAAAAELKAPLNVAVYTMTGRLIKLHQLGSTVKDVAIKLPSGHYIYKIESGKKTIGEVRGVVLGM
ncbi:MAG TPA: hypothetical protein DCO75_03315 [Fibrobacteres bacterium]|jgi:endo-1,4-beta-xylanase|nr:hypothetical protein [Fibrobacterota bacterium]